MAAVEFRNLSKAYGPVVALRDVSLAIDSGEFVTLLGPSGSGKTTLLNIVSGMIAPSGGAVLIGGQDVTAIPPRERGLGMVFQNYALMPHMTVFENVAFPLRVRKLPAAEIETRVMQVLDIVQLSAFAKRKPRELSGGQQQRVSIARCLVYEPKLILMDEPLGALDKKLREQLQLEIKRIHKELGVTILYVTHDQEEALVLSDRVCVMNDSRIEQVGTPNEIYFRPETEFVADFLGESNLIPGTVVETEGAAAVVRTSEGKLLRAQAAGGRRSGDPVKILVRPESIKLDSDGKSEDCGYAGTIRDRIFVGQATKYIVAVGEDTLIAQIGSSARDCSLPLGAKVRVSWAAENAFVVASPRP